ncbi:MAG: dTDP-4-dehydrorhamnose reductase [Candidatus Omnitrophica bacterium]|nr:dTDP-4-dehydrorhamnose reductase [Candidatus Omnitrophota bacterium]
MRILVTGATGLLGQELCRLLSSRADLVGWARRIPSQRGPVPLDSVDITDSAAVSSRIKKFRPEWVIHTAALTDVDASERDPSLAMEINGGGARNVARACAEAGAFLIAVSTDYVFDGASPRPYTEEDPTGPVNAYGRSKLEGEQAVLRCAGGFGWRRPHHRPLAGGRSLVIRVSGLFGSGRPNFVTGVVENLRAERPVKAVATQVNSPSYVVDVSQGIGRLIELNPPAGILHLANEGAASRFQVAQAVADLLGMDRSKSLIQAASWADFDRAAPRPPHSALDCGRFARLTGAPLRPWRAALQAFLQTQVLDRGGSP